MDLNTASGRLGLDRTKLVPIEFITGYCKMVVVTAQCDGRHR